MTQILAQVQIQIQVQIQVCVCVFCFLCADLLFHLLRFGLLRFINFSTSSAHHTTTTVAATTTTTNTIHIHPLKFIVCFVSLSLLFLVFSFLHSTVLHFGVGVNNIYLPLYTINHNYDNDNNNTAALVARYRFFSPYLLNKQKISNSYTTHTLPRLRVCVCVWSLCWWFV